MICKSAWAFPLAADLIRAAVDLVICYWLLFKVEPDLKENQTGQQTGLKVFKWLILDLCC